MSAIFILRTLFLIFVKVTSPKTSSKVIPWNKSLNNFLSAIVLPRRRLKKLFKYLFDTCKATYPFWNYTKYCLFPWFLPLYHFHYLEHLCIPPFFALHHEHQPRHVGTFGIQKSAKVLLMNEVEDFGNNSRCVIAYATSQMTDLCMPIACVVSHMSLRIQVDGIWTKCHYAGEIIRLSWLIDANCTVCPDPVWTCNSDDYFKCMQHTGLSSVTHHTTLSHRDWVTIDYKHTLQSINCTL